MPTPTTSSRITTFTTTMIVLARELSLMPTNTSQVIATVITTASRLIVTGKPATVGAAASTSQYANSEAPSNRPCFACASAVSFSDRPIGAAPAASVSAVRGSVASQPGTCTCSTLARKLRA